MEGSGTLGDAVFTLICCENTETSKRLLKNDRKTLFFCCVEKECFDVCVCE